MPQPYLALLMTRPRGKSAVGSPRLANGDPQRPSRGCLGGSVWAGVLLDWVFYFHSICAFFLKCKGVSLRVMGKKPHLYAMTV